MNYNILVCDDDEDILLSLQIYLENMNYKVYKATNGVECLNVLTENNIHLVLLDIMMPIKNGIDTAKTIREDSSVPIIFLSAKSEEIDKIQGLNIGADDYITKPFNISLVLAHIKAILRRTYELNTSTPLDNTNIYKTGDLLLDDNKKEVRVLDEVIPLTAIEYNILKYLMKNMDCVLSSNQIYEHVWNEKAYDVSKTISVHIRHIREKIERANGEPLYIKVIYGLGYKVVYIK